MAGALAQLGGRFEKEMELEGLEPQQVESSRQLHQKKVLMERVILRLSLLSSKNAPSWSGGFGIRP